MSMPPCARARLASATVLKGIPNSMQVVILRQVRRRLWDWTLAGVAVCVAGIACIPVTPPALFSYGTRPNEVIVHGRLRWLARDAPTDHRGYF
jgi:hypothetical protein